MAIAKAVAIGLALVALALAAATQWLSRRVEARFPPAGQFAQAGGLRIHYIDITAGPDADLAPMVFLHGAGGNARDLHGAFADSFRGRARMVFPDRPGAGYSQRGSGAMAAPDEQAKIVAALMDSLGIGRAVIVGHSLGGAVAAAFGVLFPERTAGLVFIAPATHPWPGGDVTWYYDWVNLPVLGRLFSETLAVPAGNLLYRRALKSVFAPDPTPADYPGRSGTRLVLRPANFRANAADVGGLHANVSRLATRYGEISAPVLIVTGDRDNVVLPDIHSQGLKRAIPHARLVWLEGAGHMPPYVATRAVADEIATLQQEIRAPAATR